MNIVKNKKLRKISDVVSGFWKYNVWLKHFRLLPRSLMINLTYQCNSRCVMCNIWKIKPKNEIKISKWQEVMDDDIFKEIRNLTISGGEPFLYKDIVLTVKLFVDSMPKLQKMILNTNGFLPEKVLSDVKIIAKYCQKRRVKLVVNISVDGVEEVHNKLRRVENGFKKSMETFKNITLISKRYDIKVGISSLILRQNVKEYFRVKNYFLKNKTDVSFQIVGFLKTFLKNKNSENKLGINGVVMNDFLNVLKDIRDGCQEWDLMKYYWEDMMEMYENGSNRTTPCPFLKDDFVIDSLGDVYYCLSVRPIGNFIKEKRSVGGIYFDKKNIEFRKRLPKTSCRKCNSGCNVVYALAFDLKRYLWYKLTGRLWSGKMLDIG